MSLKKIQQDVHEWTSQFEPQYWPPHQMLASLVEEMGELSREINHLHGIKKKKEGEEGKLNEELCDIMFSLVCMANAHNVNLDETWDRMMQERQYKRDQNRYQKKE